MLSMRFIGLSLSMHGYSRVNRANDNEQVVGGSNRLLIVNRQYHTDLLHMEVGPISDLQAASRVHTCKDVCKEQHPAPPGNSTWSASASTLCISTVALIYRAVEHSRREAGRCSYKSSLDVFIQPLSSYQALPIHFFAGSIRFAAQFLRPP